MPFNFSKASRDKMKGVHPDLVAVAERAIEVSEIDFKITEGVRSEEKQRKLVEAGASWTMNSRHIPATNRSKMAEAVDVAALVGKEVRWDWPLYPIIAKAFKQASRELGIPITWGGDWKVRDGPHFELRKGAKYG